MDQLIPELLPRGGGLGYGIVGGDNRRVRREVWCRACAAPGTATERWSMSRWVSMHIDELSVSLSEVWRMMHDACMTSQFGLRVVKAEIEVGRNDKRHSTSTKCQFLEAFCGPSKSHQRTCSTLAADLHLHPSHLTPAIVVQVLHLSQPLQVIPLPVFYLHTHPNTSHPYPFPALIISLPFFPNSRCLIDSRRIIASSSWTPPWMCMVVGVLSKTLSYFIIQRSTN